MSDPVVNFVLHHYFLFFGGIGGLLVMLCGIAGFAISQSIRGSFAGFMIFVLGCTIWADVVWRCLLMGTQP